MQSGDSNLTLKILTPSGTHLIAECTSVHLDAIDNKDGKGGGSVGVRKGMAKTLIALRNGNIKAYNGESMTHNVHITGGFASIANNIVIVLAKGIE